MIDVLSVTIPALTGDGSRRAYVFVPDDARYGEQRFPVLYMFDGHNVFYDSHATYGKSWGMKQYLEKTGKKLILVAVECNPEGYRRLNEYSPWDFTGTRVGFIEGLGKLTMDWFTKELKPMIDSTYRTLPEREHTMIAGSSMGGLMSIYAAVEYNEYFSRAAALSPSLWVAPKQMADMIKNKRLADPTMVYMDLGTAEVGKYTEAYRSLFNTAKNLSQSGASVAARIVPGAEHSEKYWEERIPVFFDYLGLE